MEKAALFLFVAALVAGCALQTDWSKQPLPVTVSAANYSRLSPEEIYQRVHAPASVQEAAPSLPPAPSSPLFYAFVPGEIYDSDTPLETVYHELAVPLAHRGYFNVLYEYKAGYLAKRVDYLIRVHCGVRRWRVPIVRTDKITWGSDGLVSSWHGDHPQSGHLIGDMAKASDSRIGQDPLEVINTAVFFQNYAQGFSQQDRYSPDTLGADTANAEYCLVVLDAFRFDDVRTLGKDAPCVWSTFIAVPLHPGQQFSQLLRTMARTAAPYFGETTQGMQRYEVPPGKVIMGEPIEIPEGPKTPQP
jgi:hypothetical protein